MPDRLVAGLGIGEDDIFHFRVALVNFDRPLEKGLAEGRKHHSGRIIAQHFDHILVHDLAVHLLEPEEVFLRELSAMTLVKSANDLRQGLDNVPNQPVVTPELANPVFDNTDLSRPRLMFSVTVSKPAVLAAPPDPETTPHSLVPRSSDRQS